MYSRWVKCQTCSEEYYIEHLKFPFNDIGGSLECLKCGTTLHRWSKGTDDYKLLTKDEMKKRQDYEASRPTCVCGAKMTVREGEFGLFWGCTRFPKCNHSQRMQDDNCEEYDDDEY